jgi:hypothetical protein
MKYLDLLENLTDLQGGEPAKPAKRCFEAENLRFSISQTTGRTGKTENEARENLRPLAANEFDAGQAYRDGAAYRAELARRAAAQAPLEEVETEYIGIEMRLAA